MAYHEQKIINGIPGGTVPASISGVNILTPDIGGTWKGTFPKSSQSDISISGTNPVYFDTTDLEFKWNNSANIWQTITPTENSVFGSTGVWFGANNGESGSENVNSRYSAAAFIETTNGLDNTKNYFYYDQLETQVVKIDSYIQPQVDGGIQIVKGSLDKVYINRAVTYTGQYDNSAAIKVRLAADNEKVIGSILGYSYGKLQIAVEGWDIKFLNGTGTELQVGKRIMGKQLNTLRGYIQEAPDPTDVYSRANSNLRHNGRGMVVNSGLNLGPGVAIVKVAMEFAY